MRKRIQLILAALLLLLLCAGCSTFGTTSQDSPYYLYYLNKEKTKIVPVPYTPESTGTAELIDEFLNALHQDAGSVEYRKPLLNQTEVVNYSYDGSQVSLYFNEAYATLETAEEVLCRAAVVRTLVQLPEVSCVSFYVGDAPLTDRNGNVVGLMTDESFVENPGEQINSIQTANIKLYFSNKAGNGLVIEEREVQYSSNISMEKLIVEQLLEGPKADGAVSAIPHSTKLVSVTTTNGICYVNFDESFLNQVYEIAEPIVIYSIVDSLSEIPTVNKVQISVNGETNGVYRDSFRLDALYERNLDYLTDMSGEDMKESETSVE